MLRIFYSFKQRVGILVRVFRHAIAAATMVWCVVGLAARVDGQSAPANDDYENRMELVGSSVVFSGTTVGATIQTNELDPQYTGFPDYFALSPTVWWTWTAPASGNVSIDLLDYSDDRMHRYPSFVVVWHDVDWTNHNGQFEHGMWIDVPGHRHFNFFATAGVAYDIQASILPYGTFTLRLVQTNAPVILVPPQNRLVSPGASTFLGVVANVQTNSYQWRFNGTNLVDETNAILSLDNIDATMAGSYSVLVSNDVAGVESPAGVVSIRTNDVQPTLACGGGNAGTSITFNLTSEPLTYYRIESSTDLSNWAAETSFPFPAPYVAYTSLIYNEGQQTSFTVLPTAQIKFFRAVRYAPTFGPGETAGESEVCINNLRKIRFAKELWDDVDDPRWEGTASNDTPASSDLLAYMREPICPLDHDGSFGSSYTINEMDQVPQCNLDAVYHLLEEPPDTR